jgi:hypothetical protein
MVDGIRKISTMCHVLLVFLHTGVENDVLPVVLTLAGLGSSLLFVLAVVALVHRGSRSYILITAALSALLARTGTGALLVAGLLSSEYHHLLEHSLDIVMIALLLAAIYSARTTTPADEIDAYE